MVVVNVRVRETIIVSTTHPHLLFYSSELRNFTTCINFTVDDAGSC